MNENYIKNFCEKEGLHLIEILNNNFRKDTVVFSAHKNNSTTKIAVKLCGPQSSPEIHNSLLKEIKFYINNYSPYFPHLIKFDNNFFIMEYIGKMSLSNHIDTTFFKHQEKIPIDKLLHDIQLMLDSFHSLGDGKFEGKNIDSKIVVDKLFNRLGNLISSGPKNTKKIPFESFLLRQIFKLFTVKIKKKFFYNFEIWKNKNVKFMSTYGHNDLHCNNILVENNLKLIDFENITSPGVWISDILYFYATLFALFSSKPLVQTKIKNHVLSYLINNDSSFNDNIEYLVNLFCHAADANSRFRLKNKRLSILKILSFFNSI